MARLQRIVKGRPAEVIPLPEGLIRIGRGDGNSIQLRTVASSKTHAAIEYVESKWVVTDLGSRNGTRVNNVLIERHSLQHRDVIDFAGAVFEFTEGADDDSSLGSGVEPFKIAPSIPDDSDVENSIRRTLVRPGDRVTSEELVAEPGIEGSRVVATVQIHNLAVPSWDYIDSARKISHVLRLTQVIIACRADQQIDEILLEFLNLFSAASHALLAVSTDSVDECRIVAAVSREQGQPVFLCHPLVRRAMADCEGLLVTDHWRNEPNAKPRLTELSRQSLLCVAIPGANGSSLGVIQLQASDPGNPFRESDLERLAVLSHVMGVGIAGIRLTS